MRGPRGQRSQRGQISDHVSDAVSTQGSRAAPDTYTANIVFYGLNCVPRSHRMRPPKRRARKPELAETSYDLRGLYPLVCRHSEMK